MNMIARLKTGVSPAEAQSQMGTIAARLSHDHPDTNFQRGLNVVLFKDARTQGSRRILYIASWGCMISVLLIACVNLANLQLARTAGRVREHAVRIALGASRAQLIRQLLLESVLLSLMGGALGLLLAVWGNRLLGSHLQMGPDDPGFNLPLDLRVVGFTFAASVVTGIVFGLMPAWAALRHQRERCVEAERARKLRRPLQAQAEAGARRHRGGAGLGSSLGRSFFCEGHSPCGAK